MGVVGVARMPYRDGLDGVVMASPHHLLLFFTMPVRGKREVVGMQSLPRPPQFKRQPDIQPLHYSWVLPALEAFHSLLPEKVTPLSAALLRGIPLSSVMTFREEQAGVLDAIAAVRTPGDGRPHKNHAEFSPGDEALLPYLEDAELYVRALTEGAPPAELIARARTISRRSAEGRIAKARKLGLLSPAKGRQASGELTRKAERLRTTRERLLRLEEERSNG